jgi:hypothetical protein
MKWSDDGLALPISPLQFIIIYNSLTSGDGTTFEATIVRKAIIIGQSQFIGTEFLENVFKNIHNLPYIVRTNNN